MEFWYVEVKSGQPFEVKLGEKKVLHLSQACLGELKKDKQNESVYLHITIDDKKLVLGTLHSERLPQQLFDLVFDKDFQLSHNWKNGSVYFYGYKADQPEDNDEDLYDSDEESDEQPFPIANGVQVLKKEEKPTGGNKSTAPKGSAAGKQKVKIVEPEKDVKSEGNDSDSDDSDDSDAMSEDSDEDNKDSSDDEDDDEDSDSDDDEETPKKQQSGKKRPNEADIKTPGTDKKTKVATTPQKTDGKKGGGHVATPHPSKQAGKTPANKSNQKNQKSPASSGSHSCKSCNRNFNSENALQSHNQAKHK